MKGFLWFIFFLNKRSKGLIQVHFQSRLWSYLPRVPIILTMSVCVCVCIYIYIYIYVLKWRKKNSECLCTLKSENLFRKKLKNNKYDMLCQSRLHTACETFIHHKKIWICLDFLHFRTRSKNFDRKGLWIRKNKWKKNAYTNFWLHLHICCLQIFWDYDTIVYIN